MELAYAFLANSAEGMSDGRVNVLGGDFDTIQVSGFPAVIPFMAVVIRLSCSANDFGSHHRMRIEIVGIEGVATESDVDVPPFEHRRANLSKVMVVTQIGGAVFREAGIYPVQISLDGQVVMRLPLNIVQVQA